MALPFTRPEFLQIFADYNTAIWPLQIVAWALGFFAAACLLARPGWADRAVATTLGFFWLIMAVGYQVSFFSAINPAAYVFGALFLLVALAFLIEGTVRNRLHFTETRGPRGSLAAGTMIYALLIYPLLGLVLTHPYPQTPLFGVAPCPTTIFTLGILMLLDYPHRWWLAAIPLLWGIVGGSAALLLDMPQDWGLPTAALAWIAATMVPAGSHPPEWHRKMANALQAGVQYFALVFAVGFLLGIVRTLLVVPRTGELMAVVVELPVILACAWFIGRWLITRSRVPAEIGSRMVMGLAALFLLLAAEVVLSVLVFGSSLNQYLDSLRTAQGLTGLAGQIVFGFIPVLQLPWRRPGD
jgi:hypothetical protein